MSQQLKFRLEVTKYDKDFKGVKLSCRHFTIVGEEFGPSAGEVLGYCNQEFADFLNANFPHPEPEDHSGDDFNSHLQKDYDPDLVLGTPVNPAVARRLYNTF